MRSILSPSMIFLVMSCVPQNRDLGQETGSSLSEVSLTLPSMSDFTEEQRKILSGYDLLIKAATGSDQEPGCKAPKEGEEISPITVTTLPTHSLTHGCNYWLGLRLGQISADNKAIKPIYFTNIIAPTIGKFLKASEFQGKDAISVTLYLGVTKDGGLANFAKANEPLVEDSGATMMSQGSSPNGNGNDPQKPGQPQAARKVAIQIDHGYSPTSINVASGETVELVVTRVEKNGCGDTLVLADGRTLQLNPGETKSITFTASQAGEHPLTCGMGMYRGMIVVR